MGGSEKTGELGLGFIVGPFDTRHKSHITCGCKNTCFGEETIRRQVKIAVQWVAVDSGLCFEWRWKNEEAQCELLVSGSQQHGSTSEQK